jgi:pyruvate dehydrogenase E2 component (dihydrolipoamide acetyltransferase)
VADTADKAKLVAYFGGFGPIAAEPLSRIQAAIARAMERNWSTIPHVTHHDEIEITEGDRIIRARNASGAERASLLAYLIKACVATLRAFPRFNASLDGDGAALILKGYYNIGVAVDTPRGLLVPVIRGCDVKSAAEITAEIEAVSAKARDKGLAYQAMEGGSFTVSSLGAIGGTGFTPIINAPDVAILGVTKALVRAVFRDGGFQPGLMLPLSLSYDHRVINGADAARFLVQLAADFASAVGD